MFEPKGQGRRKLPRTLVSRNRGQNNEAQATARGGWLQPTDQHLHVQTWGALGLATQLCIYLLIAFGDISAGDTLLEPENLSLLHEHVLILQYGALSM